MKRIIEFRGKSLSGDWVFGDLTQLNEGYGRNRTFIYLDGLEPVEVNPDTVGQFTGLTDKNGNEIWEGDIIRFGDSIDDIVDIVEFRHGAFGYYFIGSFIAFAGNLNFTFNPYNTDKDFEVIGNKFDNPDLLTNKQ